MFISKDDEDAYILSKIADILHSFFGTHKESFLPVFEQILSYFVKLLVIEVLVWYYNLLSNI